MLVLLATLATAFAMPPQPPWEQVPLPLERTLGEVCFPSGLRVTLRVDHRQPVVSVAAVVDRGSNDDPKDKPGASWLLQRAWYDARPGGGATVAERLQAVGARSNAVAMADSTVWISAGPSDALSTLLTLEGARLTDPLGGLDADALSRVQARADAALVDGLDAPMSLLARAMPAGFFPAGIARDDAPLNPAAIDALTPADLVAWSRNLRPGAVTLYISGDFDIQAVSRMVQDTFPDKVLFEKADGTRPEAGECKVRTLPTEQVPPKRDKKAPLTAVVGPVDAPTLLVGWSLPDGFGDLQGTLDLAGKFWERRIIEMFIDESASREQHYDPRCSVVHERGASAYLCRIHLPEGTDPNRLKTAFLDALTRTNMPIALEDRWITVQRIYEVIDTSLAMGAFTPLQGDDLITDVRGNVAKGQPLWFLDRVMSLNQIDTAKIRDFVDTWLKPDQAMARVVVPPGASPEAALAAKGKVPSYEQGGRKVALDPRVVPDDTPLPVEARLPVAPGAAPVPAPHLGAVASKVLPNGVRLVALRYDELPLVRTSVVVNDPSLAESKRGMGQWAWEMLRFNTTVELPAPRYTEAGAIIGTRYTASHAPDADQLVARGTAGNLDGMLWLLRAMTAGSTTLDSGGMRREMQLLADEMIGLRDADPAARADHARKAHVLGAAHPLAMDRWDQIKVASSLPFTALLAELERLWAPGNLTVAIVGGTDATEALQLAEEMWSDYTRKGGAKADPEPVPQVVPAAPRAWSTADAGRQRTAFGLTCAPTPASSPAWQAVGAELVRQVAWAALAGDAEALPPDVTVPTWRDAAVLDLTASLPSARAQALGQAVVDAFRRLAKDGPTATELASAIRAAQADHLLAMADADRVLEALVRHGQDLPTWAAAEHAALGAVTAADVVAWLASCRGHEAVTTVGPAEVTLSLP
ncbi:MAG: insulinase family protein [Alphaproteobacteria bacterium]|nr:insulinase family protein [Alphaproteobacteria bacterium]